METPLSITVAAKARFATQGKIMDIAIFYVVASVFVAVSAMLSGMQWNQANGVQEYLRLVLLDRPFIVVITVVIFVLSGVLMQIGKFHFRLSYYEISIIWLATSWVSLATLWLAQGIKPSWSELIGIGFCHLGLAFSTMARLSGD